MNKRQYKNYKKAHTKRNDLSEEIGKEQNKLLELMQKGTQKDVNISMRKIAKMMEEQSEIDCYIKRVILPTHLTIEDCVETIKTFCQDLGIDFGDGVGEFVENYLDDYYGQNDFDNVEFSWAISKDGQSIYVNRLRWYKNQVIKEDVKDVFKGKKERFENRLVMFTRHPLWKGCFLVKDKRNDYMTSIYSCGKMIDFLESIYAL